MNTASFDIRAIWLAVFGEDVAAARQSGPQQHRVICPFHADSHASLDVSLAKGVFICRSCEARGGALDVVVMAKYAADHREARQWLVAHGVPI